MAGGQAGPPAPLWCGRRRNLERSAIHHRCGAKVGIYRSAARASRRGCVGKRESCCSSSAGWAHHRHVDCYWGSGSEADDLQGRFEALLENPGRGAGSQSSPEVVAEHAPPAASPACPRSWRPVCPDTRARRGVCQCRWPLSRRTTAPPPPVEQFGSTGTVRRTAASVQSSAAASSRVAAWRRGSPPPRSNAAHSPWRICSATRSR